LGELHDQIIRDLNPDGITYQIIWDTHCYPPAWGNLYGVGLLAVVVAGPIPKNDIVLIIRIFVTKGNGMDDWHLDRSLLARAAKVAGLGF
jgi:hypothetical protein